MRKLFGKILSGVLAIIVSASTIFSGMPATVVFAAPETYAASQMSVKGERVDYSAVKEALEALRIARKTGSREDYIKARNLLAQLRPIDRLRLYAYLIKDFYRSNYRNSRFRFFNADKYLAENEDVRLDALRYSPDDIYSYALNHYLEHGITEGRSSGTDFDPMVAILARPEVLFDVIAVSENAVSETLYESFVQKTGKTTTASYTVLGDSLIVMEKGESISAVPTTSSAESTSSSAESVHEASASGGKSPESQTAEVGGGAQKDQRERRFINNLARDITPYTLYRNSFDNESFSYVSYNPFKYVNDNKNVEVRFLGENYRRARELAENKKYTMMLYLCGTNLENAPDYRRVTAEIVSMLQADMSNVNVILCVGGTETYGNDYLNNPEHGASGMRAGIYYLNPDGFSNEVKAKIANVSTDSGEAMFQLSDREDESTKTDLSQGLHFKDIITTDTLLQIVSTSAVDMADPSFLAGFINLATNLFPADNYGLTLSDHGGGLEGGVIFTDDSDDIKSNGITVYELESALASTDLYKDRDVSHDGKLGVIFYSACTMGSTELAYTTKDYYRYMVASEEMTSGHDSYRDIISGLNYDVGTGESDRAIAKGITYTYEISTPSHHGFNDYYVGSIATYSSDDMDNMYDKINELAAEFSEILGTDKYSDNMKKDVFLAIRKAALSCYPTSGAVVSDSNYEHMNKTSYVDIGELLTHVNNNLDKVFQSGYNAYAPSDKDEFDRLREKLDNALNTGFLVYLSIYNKEMGGITATAMGLNDAVIPLNYTMNTSGNIWTDIRSDGGFRDYLYGSSIYLPLRNYVENFNEDNSEYYKYFKDSDLDNYVNFITDYLRYLNNESESGYKTNLDELTREMSDIKLYDLVSQVKDGNNNVIRSLSDDKNKTREYISFKIPDSYEEAGIETPAHSLGSPMLDILETQPAIMVAAVHKQRFAAQKNSQNGFVEVSMICAEQPVPSFSFALDSNTISFDVTDTNRSILSGITMEGKVLGYESGDTDWQYVLRSDKDADYTDKLAILKTIFPELQEVTDINTITVSGKYKPQEGEDTECYHVFKVKDDDENQYNYQGSVQMVTDEEGNYDFHKAENVIAVSAYHYVLKEETDESGNVKYTKVALEDLEGVEDGFFNIQDLVLKTGIDISQSESVNNEWIFNGKATAYCIDPSKSGEYSELGYISERDYETGNINVGNGPLETVEYVDTQMAGIGVFGTEGPSGDTEVPGDSASEIDPVHAVGDDISVATEGCSSVEEYSAVEEREAVEEPVEDNKGDTIEPALVETRREDSEADESSSDDDTDDGGDGNDDEDNEDSAGDDSGENEETSV